MKLWRDSTAVINCIVILAKIGRMHMLALYLAGRDVRTLVDVPTGLR